VLFLSFFLTLNSLTLLFQKCNIKKKLSDWCQSFNQTVMTLKARYSLISPKVLLCEPIYYVHVSLGMLTVSERLVLIVKSKLECCWGMTRTWRMRPVVTFWTTWERWSTTRPAEFSQSPSVIWSVYVVIVRRFLKAILWSDEYYSLWWSIVTGKVRLG